MALPNFQNGFRIATPNTVMHENEVLILFGELTYIEKLMH
ncbi:hypothetical protein SAMN05660293_05416 [Dyadobacter psychrophilus]|uniref:TrkA-C domain-containing protein n=1 Tax=Dyadobacter psychrophilus TaxID=651661 RepID=A0A1T5HEH8_9BACT|nr:hypothetical protein SAMN05660293_05416 [Dyadobacter psychrophilus]